MANEGGAKAAKAGGAGKEKRQEKKAKLRGGKEKKKNPVLQEARTRYTDELKKQGVAADQLKAKLKTHVNDVVKPAMNEAKEGAKSKNLKGPERKKFIQDAVRSKLGLQA